MDNILYITKIDMVNTSCKVDKPIWQEILEKEARVQDSIGRTLISTQLIGDYLLVIFAKK